ncbi:membrane dipeptidase [Alkalibaculum bacchi]|uniref:Membrane dipeptidase n=1 Tax=Alkalibaculum bacchi TaxID=645887 RepID=A0A366I6D0_9FIRM|nr:dipeptidase [Alkalibaculum bacchi]RBP63867.1 membrane dipeptidase [Alkalibaculum bacchi]
MGIIDLHCDTIKKIYELQEESLYENSYSVDIKKLIHGKVDAQFFAMFLNKAWIEEQKLDIYKYTKEFYKVFVKELEENQEYIKLAKNDSDVKANREKGILSAFLTIEEGHFLEDKIERLEEFYELGLRLITLTWNYENCIGYPNSYDKNDMKKGLKNFGFQVVEKMNELGMIIDVSHLSDGGFYDCIKHSKKPVIASHSNARAITNVPRNLTDEMMSLLADKGGIMGLNFCPHFLGEGETSKVEDMIRHTKHIKNKAGIDVLALGTDFDGIDGELEISNIGEMNKLLIALDRAGFKTNEIEKISYLNAERIIEECLN